MPRAWHNVHVHVAIIAPAMATKRKAHTVTTKLQAVEVAEKTSKGAAALSAKNSQLTVDYGNKHDEHAVALLKDSEIVGHLPHTISCVSWFFLRCGGHIACRKCRKSKTRLWS